MTSQPDFRVAVAVLVAIGCSGCSLLFTESANNEAKDAGAVADANLLVPDAGPCAWSAHRTLTLNNLGREQLDQFPVLVVLTPSSFDYGIARPDGADLRFTDSSGALLAHEIETFVVDGTSTVWVSVSQVDANSTTNISMYYGNAAATDVQDAAAVWQNGYVGVWHMADANVASGIKDSTSGAHHGVVGGGLSNIDQIPGQVGGSFNFNGTSEYIEIPAHPELSLTDITLEAWALVPGPGPMGNRAIIEHGPAFTASWYGMWTVTDGMDWQFRWNDGNDPDAAILFETPIELDTFRYIVGVHDATAQTATTYHNGAYDHMFSEVLARVSAPGPMRFASRLNDSEYFPGQLDELRISEVTRSADWIAAQYQSMTDGMITFGPEDSDGCPP